MPDRNDGGSSQQKRWRTRYGWAGAMIALAAVTATTAVMLTGRGSSQADQRGVEAIASGRRIAALLDGIPQEGNTLGASSAPVTLQFFGDLECPTSREFTLEVLPTVINKWVRGGELRIEYRSLRTATPDAEIFAAQQAAALAAGMQNKLWRYVENFYHQQGPEGSRYVTDVYLRKLAERTPGLNVRQWSRDRTEPSLAAEVVTDEQAAVGQGLHDTPSLLIGRSHGGGQGRQLQPYLVEPLALDLAIKELLADKARSRRVRDTGSRSARRLDVAYRTGGPSETQGRAPC
jgi:protein-disulfide isomerase